MLRELLLWIFVINFKVLQAFVPESEINALKDLYIATDGSSWSWKYPLNEYGTKWNFTNTPVNPCSFWQGITCIVSKSNESILNINTIELESYNLLGEIPNTISELSYLEILNLDSNSIFGSIPYSLGNCSKLRIISLANNKINGTIPANFFSWNLMLSDITLNNNNLIGTIPEFHSTKLNSTLNTLQLSYNALTGSIPASIVLLQNLSTLDLTSNFLNSSLPANITKLSKLETLGLGTNQLTGTIPSDINLLNKLGYLTLYSNLLHGTIPDTFCDLPEMYYAVFYTNYLTGNIPNCIGNLTKMQLFVVDGNALSGTIPSSFGNLSVLQELCLYNNSLTGTVPTSLSQLSQLQLLLIQNNQLSGSVTGIFNRTLQTQLETVGLSQNHFTGEIPTEMFGPSLLSVSAFDTCFTTPLPTAICEATMLRLLDFNGLTGRCAKKIFPLIASSPADTSEISGGIPPCIWTDLLKLETLHLSGNGLSGSIPRLSYYANLTDIDLSYNRLSGEIPYELQSWSQLKSLNLINNRFRGDIRGMSQLNYAYIEADVDKAVNLSLTSNRLSGPIPSELLYAYSIDILDGNVFSCGTIPFNDPSTSTYVCGSSVLDAYLFSFLSTSTVIVLILIFMVYITHRALLEYIYHNSANIANHSTITGHVRYQQTLLTNLEESIQRLRTMISSLTNIESLLQKIKANRKDDMSSSSSWYHWLTVLIISLIYWKKQVDTLVIMEEKRSAVLKQLLVECPALQEAATMLTPSKAIHIDVNSSGSSSSQFNLGRATTMVDETSMTKLQSIDFNVLQSTNLPHLVQFIKTLRLLRYSAVVILFVQLFITILVYPLLKITKATLQQQYQWYISAAYLTGYISAIVIILIWFLVLTVLVATLRYYIPTVSTLEKNIAVQENTWQNILTLIPSSSSLVSFDRSSSSYSFVSGSSSMNNPLNQDSEQHKTDKNNPNEIPTDSCSMLLSNNTLRNDNMVNRDSNGLFNNTRDVVVNQSRYSTTASISALDRDSTATTINMHTQMRESSFARAVRSLRNTFSGLSSDSSDDDEVEDEIVDVYSNSIRLQGRRSSWNHSMNPKDTVLSDPVSSKNALNTCVNATASDSHTTSMNASRNHKRFLKKRSIWISFAALLFDMILVLVVKVFVLYLIISSLASYYITISLQMLLALMDVLWSVLAVPYIITRLPILTPTAKSLLKVTLLYFNSIVAPCIAIAVIDNSCFHGLFVKNASVLEYLTYFFCLQVSETDPTDCLNYLIWKDATTYIPPFFYNYNCYSAVLTEYIPIFLISYSIMSVTVPLMALYLMSLKKRHSFYHLLAGIFWIDRVNDLDSEADVVAGDKAKEVDEDRKDSSDNEVIEETINTLSQVQTLYMSNDKDTGVEMVGSSSSSVVTSTGDRWKVSPSLQYDTSLTKSSSDSTIINSNSNNTVLSSPQHDDVEAQHVNVDHFHNKDDNAHIHSTTYKSAKGDTSNNALQATAAATGNAVDPIKLTKRKYLFFPGYILASSIHHFIVLITFGLMCPALAVAIVLLIVVSALTWEVVIGRYLTLSPYCQPERWQEGIIVNKSGNQSNGSNNSMKSNNQSSSSSGINNFIGSSNNITSKLSSSRPNSNKLSNRYNKDQHLVPPSGCNKHNIILCNSRSRDPNDCSGGIEPLCAKVCCSPRKCVILISLGTALFYGFVTIDMVGDQQGLPTAAWAPILVLTLATILITSMKYIQLFDGKKLL